MAEQMKKPVQIHLIAAARPNFMKIAPLYHALNRDSDFQVLLVHTGQHYDANMSDDFFAELGLPDPDYHLGVGGGSHAEQTGRVMIEYEKICQKFRPDWIIVVGDVNASAACSLVGAKMHIKIAHLEAGLRSGDRSMPEEINRIVTDAISDVLWTPSPDGGENLQREGVPVEKITFVGNIMMDSFEMMRPKIEQSRTANQFGLTPGEYGVITLHRPSNVDVELQLEQLVEGFLELSKIAPMVFPVHPRTALRLENFGMRRRLDQSENIMLVDPMSYVPFMSLVLSSKFVVTDSGGLQEETTYLGIPCFTLRENTERPITIEQGTNRLVTEDAFVETIKSHLNQAPSDNAPLEFWDGKTAARVLADLRSKSGLPNS